MSDWSVVCLCADWCGVCKQYQSVFNAVARRFPDVAFHWVDIEDEADAMGEVDVETFPTLLIAQGGGVHHFGALTPQPEVLARLVAEFTADSARPTQEGSEAAGLWQRIQGVLGDMTAR